MEKEAVDAPENPVATRLDDCQLHYLQNRGYIVQALTRTTAAKPKVVGVVILIVEFRYLKHFGILLWNQRRKKNEQNPLKLSTRETSVKGESWWEDQSHLYD